jgi:hypothetical protein
LKKSRQPRIGINYCLAAPLTVSALGLSEANAITIRCAALELIALCLEEATAPRTLDDLSTQELYLGIGIAEDSLAWAPHPILEESRVDAPEIG